MGWEGNRGGPPPSGTDLSGIWNLLGWGKDHQLLGMVWRHLGVALKPPSGPGCHRRAAQTQGPSGAQRVQEASQPPPLAASCWLGHTQTG